jgi:Ca2+-binding RTX toxin-like protein
MNIKGTRHNDNDTITNGTAYPSLVGSNDGDLIKGRAGNDNLRGRGGDDVLYGNGGNDNLNGGSGDDELYGGGGNDSCIEDSCRDSRAARSFDRPSRISRSKRLQQTSSDFSSTSNNDILRGRGGEDIIVGGVGNDVLLGGIGDDLLIGVTPQSDNPGFGEQDTLTGGAGADRFVLGTTNSVFYASENDSDRAIIIDLNTSEDKVQLNGFVDNYDIDSVDAIGSGVDDTRLFVLIPGIGRKLIAIFQDTPQLSLTDSVFDFRGNPQFPAPPTIG